MTRKKNAFVKHIGFDFIITDRNEIYLVELHHRFGRSGIQELYPGAWNIYRRQYRRLTGQTGPNDDLIQGLRKICRNKIETYNAFREYQPQSFKFNTWGCPRLKKWVDSISSEYLLMKPPLGCCGKGIHVFKREDFLTEAPKVPMMGSVLIQEYIFSKKFRIGEKDDEMGIGCIRHISLLHNGGDKMNILHLPSYWRVAPVSFSKGFTRDALVANISRGAFPVKVDPTDKLLIYRYANQIAVALVARALEIPPPGLGTLEFMNSDGTITPLP